VQRSGKTTWDVLIRKILRKTLPNKRVAKLGKFKVRERGWLNFLRSETEDLKIQTTTMVGGRSKKGGPEIGFLEQRTVQRTRIGVSGPGMETQSARAKSFSFRGGKRDSGASKKRKG